MPKIKCRVALISQTPRQGDNGETIFTTNVKLTPVNILSGDMNLSFAQADVVFHPRHELRAASDPSQKTKVMIPDNSLIQEATVYVEGEKYKTFQAGYPAHPGHLDIHPQIQPLEERPAPIIEMDFP